MKSVFMAVVLFACVGTSHADYTAGVSVDSSTNILMRTNCSSGTMMSLYGDSSLRAGKTLLSYGVDGGIIERARLKKALWETDGNKSAAARLLGISERKIRYMLKKYGVEF